MTNKAVNKQRNKRRIFKFILITLISIVAILTVASFINSRSQSRLDSDDQEMFYIVEDQLQFLATELQAGGEWQGDASCSRASVKYAASEEAWCIVNYSLREEAGQEEIREKIDDYNLLIQQSDYVESFYIDESKQPNDSVSIAYFTLLQAKDEIRCYAQYEGIDDYLRTSLDCSGPARDGWFNIEG